MGVEELREAGNKAYRAGRHLSARRRYERALKLAAKKKDADVTALLRVSLAQTKLALGDRDGALTEASGVLGLSSSAAAPAADAKKGGSKKSSKKGSGKAEAKDDAGAAVQEGLAPGTLQRAQFVRASALLALDRPAEAVESCQACARSYLEAKYQAEAAAAAAAESSDSSSDSDSDSDDGDKKKQKKKSGKKAEAKKVVGERVTPADMPAELRALNLAATRGAGVNEDGTPFSASRKRREAGNGFFKAGQYAEAIEEYTQALELIDKDDPNDDPVPIYNNRALCHQQQHEYKAVVRDCTSVLEADPANVKALIRRAQALQALEKFEDALTDTRAALKIDPRIDAALKLQHALQQVLRAQRDL